MNARGGDPPRPPHASPNRNRDPLWAPPDVHLPGGPDPRRRRLRLPPEYYAAPGQAFFITVCVHHRRDLFSDRRHADAVFHSLLHGRLATEADLSVACLMPDHLHLLITPTAANLIPLLGAWKSHSTHLLWELAVQGKVWQRSFYDHALRDTDGDVVGYVLSDPVRNHLVQDHRSYPYAWCRWDT